MIIALTLSLLKTGKKKAIVVLEFSVLRRAEAEPGHMETLQNLVSQLGWDIK